MGKKSTFKDSMKALEADIQHANTLASIHKRESDGAYFQMRLSFCAAAPLFLHLFQWADCRLAGALGLLRIHVYMVSPCSTYADGRTSLSVHERKASIREFYAVIFPSLLQLERGITDLDDKKQRHLCSTKYSKKDEDAEDVIELEREREEECGICMEMNSKVVLPNCSHLMCFKCYRDWHARSQSCPFCRDSLKRVSSRDLWIYLDDQDIQDLSIINSENLRRLFKYIDRLPLMDPYPDSFLALPL